MNHEFWNTMKRTSLQIICIEGREVIKSKTQQIFLTKSKKKSLLKPYERDTYRGKRNIKNTNQTEAEKKFPLSHNNQSTKWTEQRTKS